MTAGKYKFALQNLPPAGEGLDCHTTLLGVANRGVRAGLDFQQIFDDIRQHVHGSRRVPNREIKAAIKKAFFDFDKKGRIDNCDFKSKKRIEAVKQPPAFDSAKVRQGIIDQGAGHNEADIWSSSRIKIDWQPEEDPLHLFHYLYQPDDLLFIGERNSPGILNKTIRSAADWQQYFTEGGKTFPHIIPNPLNGMEGLTQGGKPSFRADSCVKSFRFAVVEFDNLSRQDQLAFWWAVRLPVVCLIDSGNKSIHCWVRIDNVNDADSWTREVEDNLFKNNLIPLGVDGACRNEARLSRLPGHKRDTGKMQRLLYLAPKGRRISG